MASLLLLERELFAPFSGFSVWTVLPPNFPTCGLLPHLFQVFVQIALSRGASPEHPICNCTPLVSMLTSLSFF